MFVDASAIVAILGAEKGWEAILARLDAHPAKIYVSPLVRFEVVQALARKHTEPALKPSSSALERADEIFSAFTIRLQIEEIAISAQTGALAIQASAAYGKSVGHPAALNFGDCFAYACAKALGVPLLYKGDDFSRTDLA